MKLEDIYYFFDNPPPTYLCKELVVCYILSVLLQGESYGTELIQKLETEYTSYRLSDTVLYSAIKFLEEHKAITGYWKKLEGRGRPRRIYQLSSEWQTQAQNLAGLWQDYIEARLSNDLEKRKEILYEYYSQKIQNKREYIAFSKVEDIKNFFENLPPTYLSQELAVCYVLAALLQGDSYGNKLIQRLQNQYPDLRLSDTVFYSAIKFLENNNAITRYYKKVENRARPVVIYKITPEWETQARYLANLWHEYVNTEERVDVINALGDAYNASGEFYKAVEYHQKSLAIAEEIDYANGKVLSLFSLGNVYSERIKGNRLDNLENAINAYNSALNICIPEDFPEYWAQIQNALGDAYSKRIEGENVENAIAAYTAALNVYTRQVFPQQWAKTQNNLGIAFSTRIIGDKPENLKTAIGYYQAALEVYNREEFPHNWAETCSNIGDVYIQKIQDKNLNPIETLSYIEYAILFYKDALEIYNQDEFPHKFAIIREKQIGAHHLFEEYQSNFDYYRANFQKISDSNLPESIVQSETEIRLERERITGFVIYEVLVKALENTNNIKIGEELGILIYLKRIQATGEGYFLQLPQNEATGNELNIILNAPDFHFNNDNTTSLPLDPDTGDITQTATFNLTALRPGKTKIQAELYVGEIYKKTLETEVEINTFEENQIRPLIAARSRPVPQPSLILQVRTTWNADISACVFNYHIDSYQSRLLFADNFDCASQSLSAIWVERTQQLLKATLEDAANSQPGDFRSRLVSFGQYLFKSLFPEELQSTFRTIANLNHPFTLLIIADQDARFPWELFHDGKKFLGDRLIIGRWLWELEKARPYEFPVGAVNVAHYANVEQPELWNQLLYSSGAPPPISMQAGIFNDMSLFESIRGLHLIRYSQSANTENRQDTPVRIDNGNDIGEIEREVQPAKLSLRRNHPLVSLSYVNAGQMELTALEQTWASTFVRAGCSAFVGSLWAVQADVEAAFISTFYNSIWSGQTLAVAFSTARKLAQAVVPESLDWLAYVLFGDPMARPYRPVPGQGYAVVEPIGQEIDDPVAPGATVRFRVSLRRTPPVWYENRLMEVAEDLTFDDLRVWFLRT